VNAHSNAESDDGPVRLSRALDRLRADLGLPAGNAVHALLERWEQIVGPELARHARLESLRDGVAVIAVDSPPWATHVRFLEPTIVEHVATAIGESLIQSIRVRVEPLRT
jgi:predicted nucleic acid-binding Zn ribbon protein